MNEGKDIVFWSVDDYVEELRFGTIEECLEDYVAGFDPDETLPDKVEVFGWKRLKIKDDYAAEMVLKKLLERWDEDYERRKKMTDDEKLDNFNWDSYLNTLGSTREYVRNFYKAVQRAEDMSEEEKEFRREWYGERF